MSRETRLSKDFNPNIFHSRYFIRQSILKGISEQVSFFKGKLVDFGCGNKPYETLFNVTEYIGVEYEGAVKSDNKADVFYDGSVLPFEDQSVDCVFSSEVVEHLFNPQQIFKEFHRILKPGGHILITCPFVWNEHEAPYDYARYTQWALKHMLENANLEIVALNKKGSFGQAITQIILLYILKPTFIKKLPFLEKTVCVIVNTIGNVLHVVLPTKWDFYLSNIVLARRKA